MKQFEEKWIVANNGLDINKADESFEEVATAFNKDNAKIIAVAPEMFNALIKISEEIISGTITEDTLKLITDTLKKTI